MIQMTDPAQPVPVLPLAYASEAARDFSGLRRLRRGLIVLAISRFLVFLLIAFVLLAWGANPDLGFRAERVIWMYYTAVAVTFLVGGCLVLGVGRSGQRGFSNGRLLLVLILIVCMILRTLLDVPPLFQMYLVYRWLTALRFLPDGNLARLVYDSGWVVAGLWVLVHVWQTLRRISGGFWLQALGWTFAATGAVWLARLLFEVNFIFGKRLSPSLRIGSTVLISEQLMDVLRVAIFFIGEGVVALAAGVLLLAAVRSLRRTAVPAAPT